MSSDRSTSNGRKRGGQPGHLGNSPELLPILRVGWRSFHWGAGVMAGQGIPPEQLRASAAMRPPGDEDQWLPVWLSPASSYTLVIRGNATLPVASVRIVDAENRIKTTCLRNSRIDQDVPCQWQAKDLPAGTYRLIIRALDDTTLLNTALRHDPRWLRNG